ncbi:MAG TPA: hypothetical protein VN905_11845 [Candidatus Binatia bacterium]|nr:hypothetical protein [Candidatus Binatia bacterium]
MSTQLGARVLIASVFDWWSTYRAVQILGRAGAQVETLGDPTLTFTRSRFVSRAIAASRQPAEIAATLEAQLERERYDWVIVADDVLFTYLGSLPNPWWVRPWFPVAPGSRAFAFATSKLAFPQICRDAGLPVPEFALARTLEHALDAARSFGYPVIGKTAFGFAGRAVTRLENARALQAWWQGLQPPAIVQRFIVGRYATTEMLFDRGKPRAYFSSIRSNFWPTPLGTSATRTLANPPGIDRIVELLGTVTEMDGFCNICWIWGDDGVPYLSEFNPRPTPGYLLHPTIRDMLVAAVRDRFAAAPHNVRTITELSQTIQQFPEHFAFAATNGGFRRWCEAFASIGNAPLDEPALALAQARAAIKLGREMRRRPP